MALGQRRAGAGQAGIVDAGEVAFDLAGQNMARIAAKAFGSPKVDAVPLLAAYVATFLGYWFGAARWGGPKTKQTVGVAD